MMLLMPQGIIGEFDNPVKEAMASYFWDECKGLVWNNEVLYCFDVAITFISYFCFNAWWKR